jgi:prepilin-type N-terminal cleavage/methylation domain-containing protein
MIMKQNGFSLIELMIAMVISLILSEALIVTFMSERVTFTNQQNLSSLQENQLITLNRVNDVVNAASFFSDTMNYTLATAFPAKTMTSIGSFSAGQGILGISNTSFAIRYQLQGNYKNTSAVVVQKNNNIQDCLGNKSSASSPSVVTNVFSFDATSRRLLCSVYNDSGSTQQAVVADNISNINVTYGYDSTGNGSVTRYATYDAITDWTSVKSVMINFSFENPYDSSKTIPINAVFVMNNKVK